MKVAGVRELRQGHEVVPGERDRVLDVAVNFQAPVVEIDVGMDAEIEDGEIVNLALAGRERSSERIVRGSLPAILRAQRSLRAM